MNNVFRNVSICCFFLVARLLGENTQSAFNFLGPEIFPIDPLISRMQVGDIDADGFLDIIVANNMRSKISILYNQSGDKAKLKQKQSKKFEINELPPDARFRIESISSEKRISSLIVADLNSDKKPDLAYYGEPKELIIQYHLSTNGWSAPKQWPIADGTLGADSLACGDLNGDGLTDLLLLGEKCCYFFAQNTNQGMNDPIKIPYSETVKSMQIIDINGDGRSDLLLNNSESTTPCRIRLQNQQGQLGPEIFFTGRPYRALHAEDLNQDKKAELIAIAQNSGRAQLMSFCTQPGEILMPNLRKGQLAVLPLNRTGKSKRGFAWGDVDGDNLDDLLVAEPENGQLTVYRYDADGVLLPGNSFPTFMGVTEISLSDWDGDGKNEVFVLSQEERQMGIARIETNGRITFPKILSTESKPLAIATGRLKTDAKPLLFMVCEQDNKRWLKIIGPEGEFLNQKLGENFKSIPSAFILHDTDQDGKPDLVLLNPYEKIKVLRQIDPKTFQELDVAVPGGTMDQPWMNVADLDGDGRSELLFGQKSFVRGVVLTSEVSTQSKSGQTNWTFQVKEQINGISSNSRIAGAITLHFSTNLFALFLLDLDQKAVSICERNSTGAWQVNKNIPLPVSDFISMQTIALKSTMKNSLAFLGMNSIAWMQFGGTTWDLKELDGYETSIKDGYLKDVVAGDLDHDKTKDLVFMETSKNNVDLVAIKPSLQMQPVIFWKVFEERSFRGQRNDSMEPREALIADMTGDGKNDLILLVHDRILLYPQE